MDTTTSEKRRDDIPPEEVYEADPPENTAVSEPREPFQNIKKYITQDGTIYEEGEVTEVNKVPGSFRLGPATVEVKAIWWDPLGLPRGTGYIGTNDEGWEIYRCRPRIQVEIVDMMGKYEHNEGKQEVSHLG